MLVFPWPLLALLGATCPPWAHNLLLGIFMQRPQFSRHHKPKIWRTHSFASYTLPATFRLRIIAPHLTQVTVQWLKHVWGPKIKPGRQMDPNVNTTFHHPKPELSSATANVPRFSMIDKCQLQTIHTSIAQNRGAWPTFRSFLTTRYLGNIEQASQCKKCQKSGRQSSHRNKTRCDEEDGRKDENFKCQNRSPQGEQQ